MPKGGGSSRGRLVYRPQKVITKNEEEEEPNATGEPGVADEARHGSPRIFATPERKREAKHKKRTISRGAS